MTKQLNPIVTFAENTPEANFARVEEDGLPFIGEADPMLTEREHEERQKVVAFSRSKVFDTQNPDDMEIYHDVINKRYCEWYRICHVNYLFDPDTRYIFMIWAARYITHQKQRDPFAPNTLPPSGPMPQTAGIYTMAGDMINSIITMGEMDTTRNENEVKIAPSYQTRSGVFDILDEEHMQRFHEAFDGILRGDYFCDCLKIQYDQDKRKIFMVWVEEKSTPVNS